MIKITALRNARFLSKSMKNIGLLLFFGSIFGACSSDLGRNVDLATQNAERAATVSYTHLTLPTKRIV